MTISYFINFTEDILLYYELQRKKRNKGELKWEDNQL